MRVLTTQRDIDAWLSDGGAGGVLVPTMGALHAGHAALIEHASELARRRGLDAGCAVTIFVNPTQFNEPGDYTRYPRTLDADLELCARGGASAVVAPDPRVVYPPDREIPIGHLPRVATAPGLEDASRPGHFAGVVQVVRRLFELTRPSAAVFGEKDWQQLQVVSAMVRNEGMGVEIVGRPTVRDPDGLAMSSRNRFLSAAERAQGLALRRGLLAAGQEPTPARAEEALRRVLAEAGLRPDYAVVRPGATLEPGEFSGVGDRQEWRSVVAARVGVVRLLDNAGWPGEVTG